MFQSRALGTGHKLLPKGEGGGDGVEGSENFSCVTMKFTLFPHKAPFHKLIIIFPFSIFFFSITSMIKEMTSIMHKIKVKLRGAAEWLHCNL